MDFNPPIPRLAQLNDLLSDLQQHASHLENRNKADIETIKNLWLSGVLDASEKRAGSNVDFSPPSSTSEASSTGSLDESESKVANNETDITEVRFRINEAQNATVFQTLTDYNVLLDKYKELVAKQKADESRLQEMEALVTELSTQGEALTQDKSVLQNQLLASNAEKYEERLQQLTAENESLKAELSRLQSSNESAESKSQVVEAPIEAITKILREHKKSFEPTMFSSKVDDTFNALLQLIESSKTKKTRLISSQDIEQCFEGKPELMQVFQNPTARCNKKTALTNLAQALGTVFKSQQEPKPLPRKD